MFREIREELIWADGGAVKKATDAAILSLLGPKTEADQQAAKKKPAKKVGRYCPMHLIHCSKVCVTGHEVHACTGAECVTSSDMTVINGSLYTICSCLQHHFSCHCGTQGCSHVLGRKHFKYRWCILSQQDQ